MQLSKGEQDVVAALKSIIDLRAGTHITARLMYSHIAASMFAGLIDNTNNAVERCLAALENTMDKKIVSQDLISARAALADADRLARDADYALEVARTKPRLKGGKSTRSDDVHAAFLRHQEAIRAVEEARANVSAIENGGH